MDTNQSKKSSPTLGAPKNFLIPVMLLHLRDWNAHGYELIEKLTKFGIQSLDHGNFYRILRQLEKDSLVTSVWDTTSGGPAKRIYSITEAGEQYLDMWAGPLSDYQKMLNSFFNLYNPFNFSLSPTPTKSKVEPNATEEKQTKSNEVLSNKTETKADLLENGAVSEDKTTKEEQQKTAVTTTTAAKPATKKPTTRRTTKPRTPRATTTPTAKTSTNTQKSNKD